MINTGYAVGGAQTTAPAGAAVGDDDTEYWSLRKLRKAYLDYLGNKTDEIAEQKDARRYYHGAQWTADQIKALKKRKQPVVTSNRIVRKIDAVVGLVERLRQDPKGFPRTPQHEKGAELATAVLRFVLDDNEWQGKSPECARDCAIEGIGGIEYDLAQGDQGDPDLEIHIVDPDTFFYDPRSFRQGFADARFMGVGKWVDIETAKELAPGKEALIDSATEAGTELTSNSDRETKWFQTSSENRKLRLVDCWYKHRGEWCWCLFVGSTKLSEGKSPFIDEKGKTFPRYRMFSASVDHDGDRYGFVRNLKSPQDEINHRRSKALHILNSRRLILSESAVQDIEKVRSEWARPDGVVIVNPGDVREKVQRDDQTADFMGQLKFLEESKAEIENFGPNPALIGQGLEDSSGRAISLLQQAGIAELGPYLLSYKQWKIRVYRDIWNIVQRHWKSERWIRVTDDQEVAQFFQVNKLELDQFGMPAISNALGSLDVDIILDEGPDQVNMQADNYAILQSLGPAFAQEFPELAIELSPLVGSVKKKMLDKLEQAKQNPKPDPKAAAMQAQLQADQAKAQFDAQMQQQKQAADMDFQERKGALDAQQKQSQLMADIELEQIRTAAQIQLEREKAAAQLEIEHLKAQAKAQLDARMAEHQAELSTAKAETDAEIAKKAAKAKESSRATA